MTEGDVRHGQHGHYGHEAGHSLPAGYTTTAKALHWGVVVLLAVQFVVAWTMPHIGRNTQPETLINLHLSLGALILGVAVVRLAWRLTMDGAEPPPGLTPFERVTSRLMHGLLYVLLLVVPALGWINASWRGFPVTLFGLFELPKVIATRAPGFRWTGDVHTILAYYVMLALIGLHVAAALYHHFVRRDAVLRRMLPGH